MIAETQPPLNSREVWRGVLLWCVFAVLAVALRGVRWDENYEFAQAITGRIPYPEGHPLFLYTRGLYSIQTWELAGLMAIWDSPLLLNGMRNVLFLMATTIPVFLWTVLLTGRARWGHAAAVLVLMGIHVPFYSNYPVQVWPDIYSNGHIGLGWALITACLLASPHHRLGFLMAGLMPMVHLGQFPPVLALAVLRALLLREDRLSVRQAGVAAGTGLLLCVVFWLVIQSFGVSPATEGAYASGVDADAVYRGYMTHHAAHRAIPMGTGHLLLGGTLLLSLAAAWRVRGLATAMAAAYAVTLCATVWIIMALHMELGADLPHLLIGWMPYRLINHAGPLLIAVGVAVLVARDRSHLLVLLLLFGFLRPILGWALPEAFFARYLADGAAALFLLWGAGVTALPRAWPLAPLGVAVLLLVDHQFGAACVAGGALLAWFGLPRQVPAWAVPAAALATVLVLVAQQVSHRQHLPVSPFEREARAYLAAQGAPDAMVLVRHQQEGLQARLGHPVMTDMATPTWVPYRRDLGPVIWKLYRDCYGIDFETKENPVWHTYWPSLTLNDWYALSHKYDFEYVLAPAFMDLPLDRVVTGEHNHLYHVTGGPSS